MAVPVRQRRRLLPTWHLPRIAAQSRRPPHQTVSPKWSRWIWRSRQAPGSGHPMRHAPLPISSVIKRPPLANPSGKALRLCPTATLIWSAPCRAKVQELHRRHQPAMSIALTTGVAGGRRRRPTFAAVTVLDWHRPGFAGPPDRPADSHVRRLTPTSTNSVCCSAVHPRYRTATATP
jgi:hypothetical protein